MLPNLYKDTKVQKELNLFRIKIKQIENKDVRSNAEVILKKLREEIQNLEDNHRSQLIGELRPSLYYVNRERIQEYRIQLKKILRDSNIK